MEKHRIINETFFICTIELGECYTYATNVSRSNSFSIIIIAYFNVNRIISLVEKN